MVTMMNLKSIILEDITDTDVEEAYRRYLNTSIEYLRKLNKSLIQVSIYRSPRGRDHSFFELKHIPSDTFAGVLLRDNKLLKLFLSKNYDLDKRYPKEKDSMSVDVWDTDKQEELGIEYVWF